MTGLLNFEYYVYLQLTFVIQLFACQLLLTPSTIKKRDHFNALLVVKILVDITVAFIAYLYQFFFTSSFINTLIIYIGMYLYSSLSYLFIYEATFKDAIYITTIGYVFQHIAYKCNSLIVQRDNSTGIQANAYSGVYPSYSDQIVMVTDKVFLQYFYNILFQFLIYAAVDAILYFLVSKKFKKNYENSVSNIYTLEISLISLFITIVMNTYFLFIDKPSNSISIIISVFTITICAFILYNCSIQMELSSSKKEKILIENQYKEKIRQYELSKESIDLINIKCHDLRKQIRYLKANNQGTISNEELTKIENAIRIYDTSIRTGNEVIDTILQEKSLIMKEKRILGTFLIDGKALSFMKKEDVFALFENIIDNAIEALGDVEDKEKRNFSLKAILFSNYVCIEETNYYEGNLNFDKKGMPITTKNDTNYHGFGTKSIEYVAKQLHGKVKFSSEDSLFTVKVIIPVK